MFVFCLLIINETNICLFLCVENYFISVDAQKWNF